MRDFNKFLQLCNFVYVIHKEMTAQRKQYKICAYFILEKLIIYFEMQYITNCNPLSSSSGLM